LSHEHESNGWYQKNHPDTIKEIEEHLFLKKIRTKEDFPVWLENAKRSLITDNRKWIIANNIILKPRGAKHDEFL
jgi:hypothetical protein